MTDLIASLQSTEEPPRLQQLMLKPQGLRCHKSRNPQKAGNFLVCVGSDTPVQNLNLFRAFQVRITGKSRFELEPF